MYRLRAACDAETATQMARLLAATAGVATIVRHPGAETTSALDVIEADVAGHAVDDVVHALAAVPGAEKAEVTISPSDDVQRYRFEDRRARRMEDDPDDDLGISATSNAFRRLTRVDLQYGLLMAAAALVATAGLIGGLPIAVVGAMAFSPDLGRLNAMSFAIIAREGALFVRGALSLLVGLASAVVVALTTTLLLSIGVLEDPLSGVPDLLADYITVLDGVTVTVAIGAGVAAMVVFITDHGTAAVGVGVSITTMPAAAYAGIALADQDWTAAGDALIVLTVNIACVVSAGVVTGLVLRRHLQHRAQVLRNKPALGRQ